MFEGERAFGATFAPEQIGWLDFETRSETSLKLAGPYRYACDASAIVLAYAIGDEPARTAWKYSGLAWADLPDELKAHQARVEAGQAVWAAWNAGFDRAIWNYAVSGSRIMEPHHIIDVMAQGAAAGLPPDLMKASRICGREDERKLETGRKLMELFCLPGAAGDPRRQSAQWRQFLLYALRDIDAMRAVFRCTRQLPLAEWKEYWAMESINSRGIGIDLSMVAQAASLAEQDRERANRDVFALTRGEVETVNQVRAMVGWLRSQIPDETGVKILTRRQEEVSDDGTIRRPAKHSLTRPRVERLLAYCQDVLDDVETGTDTLKRMLRVQRLLQIRLYGGSRTPAKFNKMAQQHVDGVLYGQYVFNGAGQTGRASSRGVQIHNLARDVLSYEHDAIEHLLNGANYDTFARLGDDTPVSRKLSLLIRPSFVPRPGNVFVWSDWSQIEARILPWLAGAEERLEIFRQVDADPSVPDLYTRTTATLSHVDVKDVTKAMRQRGKVAELALGFGGSVYSLQTMAASYGLHLTDAEASATVTQWRAANPWCVRYWEALWEAILRALERPRQFQPVGHVGYVYLPDYLYGTLLCVLPSGRCLAYRRLKEENVAVLDDDDEPTGEYERQWRFSRGIGRVKFWPGMAAENIVQAVAADCLRGTLRRLEDERHDVRLHTHDEILLEAPDQVAEPVAIALREAMQRGFAWSAGLPLKSAETISPYYTKIMD